jgi:hypothetical protein
MTLRATAIGLTGACAGLAWLCLRLFEAPVAVGEIAPGPPWAPDRSKPALESDVGGLQGADPVILARLVFSPTRRPPEPRLPEPQAAEPQSEETSQAPRPIIDVAPPEGAVLRGIFIADARREALVTSPGPPDGLWLKPGSAIDGWTLSRIETDRIALSSGEREIALTLYVDNSGK